MKKIIAIFATIAFCSYLATSQANAYYPSLMDSYPTKFLKYSYTNSAYKFNISFPSNFSIKTSDINSIGFHLNKPIVQIGQNITYTNPDNIQQQVTASGNLVISVQNAITRSKCYSINSPIGQLTERVVINGISFEHGTFSDHAAGNTYDSSIYRTYKDKVCYGIDYVIHTSSDGSPWYNQIKQEAKQYFESNLNRIVSSFTLLK
ncbi:MAG: hypothetical protein ABIB04_00315 [Patescibacteria group bacterium]